VEKRFVVGDIVKVNRVTNLAGKVTLDTKFVGKVVSVNPKYGYDYKVLSNSGTYFYVMHKNCDYISTTNPPRLKSKFIF
jgi:hypothetical protein